jgi:hypothetical protein
MNINSANEIKRSQKKQAARELRPIGKKKMGFFSSFQFQNQNSQASS